MIKELFLLTQIVSDGNITKYELGKVFFTLRNYFGMKRSEA